MSRHHFRPLHSASALALVAGLTPPAPAFADCAVTSDVPPPSTASMPSSGDTVTCTAGDPPVENAPIINRAANGVTVVVGDGEAPEEAIRTQRRAIELGDGATITVLGDGEITTTGPDSEGIQLDEAASIRVDGLVRVQGESSEAIDMDYGDIVVGPTGVLEALGPNRTAAQQAEAIEIDNGGGARPGRSTVTVEAGGRVFSQSAEAVQVRSGGVDGTLDLLLAGSAATGVAGGTALRFGDGTDTLTLRPTYELTGLADGGALSDDLILEGGEGTAAEADAEQYLNFELLRKTGAGTWTLTGTAPNFAPDGIVEEGTLVVEGTVARTGMAVPAGTLAGTGTIGALDATGGTVAPGPLGDELGTLDVAGDARFAPGSTFAVDLAPDPAPNPAGTDFPGLASDRLAVEGAATIDGGTIRADGRPGDYPQAGAFTILTAGGGVSGTFDGVTDNLPDIDLRDIYNANSVQLVYRQAQEESPKVIFPSTTDAVADAGRLYTETLQRRGGLVAGAIPTTPETGAVAPITAVPGAAYKGGFIPPPVVAAPRRVAVPAFGAWAVGMGAHAQADGAEASTGAVPGFDADAYGAAAGIERRFGPGGTSLAGLSLGYTRTDVDTDDAVPSSAEVDALHLGVYASTVRGPLTLSGALGYARLDYDFEREFALNDGTLARATSGADGDLYAASLAASYDVSERLGFENLRLAPTATLDALHVTRDATREDGAGVLDLDVDGDDTTRVYAGVGVTVGTTLVAGGTVLTPEASVMWERAFGDLRTVTASAIPAAETDFATAAAPIDRDRLRVGAGLGIEFNDRVSGHVRYDGAFGSDSESHRGSAGVAIHF
ncbi:outer membrane autotransporter protein [Hasllibacter halocynthiae]|uniref:Outer membrane autotransporter protein n=1 Tax=Hasllibacter halocynthiae TaxID=595589 RepID=A0A2T0WZD7_9RHOB|nr:autotransporter outer membrane beta-barrel domain-containing protein [Hasllibacter halocynthiae]PRY92049.1 outer membrane autotransporter protein [Hasllibacter halocynthiae]